MLSEFWGGATLSAVNQVITLLMMGGLAGPILVIRKFVERGETDTPRLQPGPPPAGTPRSQARVAAVVAAVHAAAAPGAVRIVGIARLGAESPWRAAGRLEALGMEPEPGQQRH